MLTLAVCAMLCGAHSLYAIAQPRSRHWATPGVQPGEDTQGRHPGKPPGEATFQRVFKDLDVTAFEAVLREWLIDSGVGLGPVLSLDGKTLRGIHGEEIAGAHPVSAYAARSGAVLAQAAAPGKGQELAAAKAVPRQVPWGER